MRRDVPVHAFDHLVESSRFEPDALELKLEGDLPRSNDQFAMFSGVVWGYVAVKIEFHLNLMKYLIKSAFETRNRESAYRYLRPTLLESAHKVVTTTE